MVLKNRPMTTVPEAARVQQAAAVQAVGRQQVSADQRQGREAGWLGKGYRQGKAWQHGCSPMSRYWSRVLCSANGMFAAGIRTGQDEVVVVLALKMGAAAMSQSGSPLLLVLEELMKGVRVIVISSKHSSIGCVVALQYSSSVTDRGESR